jgi:protein-tyrosine phosphatase
VAVVGADQVVCLCEREELEDRYPAYVDWLEAEGPSGRALWFPVPDLHAPPVDQVMPFLDRLAASLASGDRLLMHCGAGIGRAGTFAAAVLVHLGASRAEAVAAVAAARPLAGPEAGAQGDLLDALEVQESRP